MRALLFKEKGDKATALGDLRLALSLAEPGGLIMTFVSKGAPVADLLEEVVKVKDSEPDDTEIFYKSVLNISE